MINFRTAATDPLRLLSRGTELTTNSTAINRAKFGCGFVFGFVVGLIAVAGSSYAFGYTEFVYVLIISIVFGFAAMKFGKAFWRAVKIWIP